MTDPAEADLPVDARRAWQAYVAMRESKEAYFSLLSEIEQKYRNRGEPTQEESGRLEVLLQQHDAGVRAFTEAMAAVTSEASRQALLLKLQTASEE
jgi:DUF1365 family protein